MSMINYAAREINCKIVYYGPGLGGKTTNLEHIYGKVKPETRGKLISLATENERTRFFDFPAGGPRDDPRLQHSVHLYTVPGQSIQRQSEAHPQEVDGIVFVSVPQYREWKRISSRCRTCTTTWRSTVRSHPDAVCHS